MKIEESMRGYIRELIRESKEGERKKKFFLKKKRKEKKKGGRERGRERLVYHMH